HVFIASYVLAHTIYSIPLFFFILTRPQPRSTLFPYTTLFRSPQETTKTLRNKVISLRAIGIRWRNGSRRAASPINKRSGSVGGIDRKSTRLNSSHGSISYAVFCLKKKKTEAKQGLSTTTQI